MSKRARQEKLGIKVCARHVKTYMDTLGYNLWHYEADRRYKKGERQTQCPDCQLWFFPDELGPKEASK